MSNIARYYIALLENLPLKIAIIFLSKKKYKFLFRSFLCKLGDQKLETTIFQEKIPKSIIFNVKGIDDIARERDFIFLKSKCYQVF